VEHILERRHGLIRIAEVGAHLGVCLFWAVTRIGCDRVRDRVEAWAYQEAIPSRALRLVHESIEMNRFQTCVTYRGQEETDAAGGESRTKSSMALDVELGVNKKYHIWKIRSNDKEDDILRSGREMIEGPGVGIVVITTDFAQIAYKSLRYLQNLPKIKYTCVVSEDQRSVTWEDFDTRDNRSSDISLSSVGPINLVCERSDLDEWLRDD